MPRKQDYSSIPLKVVVRFSKTNSWPKMASAGTVDAGETRQIELMAAEQHI